MAIRLGVWFWIGFLIWCQWWRGCLSWDGCQWVWCTGCPRDWCSRLKDVVLGAQRFLRIVKNINSVLKWRMLLSTGYWCMRECVYVWIGFAFFGYGFSRVVFLGIGDNSQIVSLLMAITIFDISVRSYCMTQLTYYINIYGHINRVDIYGHINRVDI